MATETIPAEQGPCKTTAKAYFLAASSLELLAMDAERIAETAFALATCEAFPEAAQHAFYTLGVVADRMKAKAKKEEDRFYTLYGKGEAQA